MADKKKKFDINEVWPSMLNFLKGFPKNLKPMVKDPVTTLQEVENRRKDVMGLMYTSVALLVVLIVLSAIIGMVPALYEVSSIIGGVGIVPLAGICVAAFLLSVLKKAETKFKALTCKKCGIMLDLHTREDMDKYVGYELITEKCFTDISHPSSDNGTVSYVRATGDVKAAVAVAFTCPECGEVKSFVYYVDPFKIKAEQRNVSVVNVEIVKTNLSRAVREVMDEYENGDRTKIPYSIQSVHHPRNAEKTKPQAGYESYRDVSIIYHRDIDEMVEGLFIHNELNGTIKESE